MFELDGFCYLDITLRSLLISAYVLLAFSLVSFEFLNYKRYSVILLFISALVIGFFYAAIDPFLHVWDEQFHALVARNMINHPFDPVLFSQTVHGMDYTSWVENDIWLHKQPLFLWQMATSMWIFGSDVVSMRIPGVLMHAGMVFLIYRIGSITTTRKVAFYSAALFAFAQYPLELVSGIYCADQNDTSFIFYITASLWAFFEFKNSGRIKWVYVIGFFAGCAILCKWMAGLLVFGTWGLSIIFFQRDALFKIKTYVPVLIALLICIVTFIPWQIYIFSCYPEQACYEFTYTMSHFSKAIEGHTGDALSHFYGLYKIYGDYFITPYIILAGLATLYFVVRKKEFYILMAGTILAVYTFFTLAATKMDSFVAIVYPFVFIALGSLPELILSFLPKRLEITRKVTAILLVLFSVYTINDLNLTFHNRNKDGLIPTSVRKQRIRQLFFFNKTQEILRKEKYVIYNAGFDMYSNIQLMYITDYISYPGIPSPEWVKEAKSKGYKIAVYDLFGLPEYIVSDKDIKVIHIPMLPYDEFSSIALQNNFP